jgi:hypothetical protein
MQGLLLIRDLNIYYRYYELRKNVHYIDILATNDEYMYLFCRLSHGYITGDCKTNLEFSSSSFVFYIYICIFILFLFE